MTFYRQFFGPVVENLLPYNDILINDIALLIGLINFSHGVFGFFSLFIYQFTSILFFGSRFICFLIKNVYISIAAKDKTQGAKRNPL